METSRIRPSLYGGRHSANIMPPQNKLSNNIAENVSGSRALSSHILWRTAYRRDHLPSSSSAVHLSRTQFENGLPNVEKDDGHLELSHILVIKPSILGNIEECNTSPDFQYPFNDLLVWAVMTKRHEMALCMLVLQPSDFLS